MEPALAIFGALLGHCWQAQIGPELVDTHCFTDMWDGSHVRDRHVVTDKGKSVYEGETIYSFDGKAISFIYLTSMGGVGNGTAQVSAPRISFVGSMKGTPTAASEPIKVEWTLLPDGFDVIAEGDDAPRQFRVVR